MTMLPKVQRIKMWWQRILIFFAVIFLRVYWATLRIKFSKEARKIINNIEDPAIFAFWHENLFVAYMLRKALSKGTPIYGLVSPSKDGAWLAELFRMLGIKTIRGSSGRRGISAIAEMSNKLQSGAFVAITPDGPRGPVHKFKNGTAMTAQGSKTDVVLVAVKYNLFCEISTWDRFKIPMPFSKVIITGKFIYNSDFETLQIAETTEMFERELLLLQKKI